MPLSSDEHIGHWNLVFVRYANPEVRWTTHGYVINESILLIEGSSAKQVVSETALFIDDEQPIPEDVSPICHAKNLTLKLIGIYEIIPINSDWRHGVLLGMRSFSYQTWEMCLQSLITRAKIVDFSPQRRNSVIAAQKEIGDVPPRSECEMNELSVVPYWYLVEVTYASGSIRWEMGGIAVAQCWYLIRASIDSEAHDLATELAAQCIRIEDSMARNTRVLNLPIMGVTNLVPTWEPWMHGAELGYREFEYDESVSFEEIVDEAQWKFSKKGDDS